MNNEIRDISVDIIDDPVHRMRSEMDEKALHELSLSIVNQGLIQPISVRPVGDRYEVIAGHRRFIAFKMAALPTIPARIMDVSDEKVDTLRMHENFFRQDFNPVDEATFLYSFLKKEGATPESIANIASRTVEWVRSRLIILEYPDFLIEAIAKGKISLGAAQWLAKIEDENQCRRYVDFGIRGGLSVKMAIAWYTSWKNQSLPPVPEQFEAPEGSETPKTIDPTVECQLCFGRVDPQYGKVIYCHPDCHQSYTDNFNKPNEKQV